MGRSLLSTLLLAGAALLAGCALFATESRTAGDSPEKAFERVRAALEAGDWGTLYDVAASPSTQRQLTIDFSKVKRDLERNGGAGMFARSVLGVSREEYLLMTARDFFVRMSEVSGERGDLLVAVPERAQIEGAKIADTEIEGDQAVVMLELADGPRPLPLMREGGRWYVQVFDVD